MGLMDFGGGMQDAAIKALKDKLESNNLGHFSVSAEGKNIVVAGKANNPEDVSFVNSQASTIAAVGLTLVNNVSYTSPKTTNNNNFGADGDVQEYIVKDGDTPWAIAQHFYGDGNKYTILEEYNNFKGHIYTGNKLYIPNLKAYVSPIKAQTILNAIGFNVGAVDGVIGNQTKTAIRNFQQNNGLSTTGELDNNTRNALRNAFQSESVSMDKQLLQMVLKEAGYYKGAIDGVIGNQSIAALNAFQDANGLSREYPVNERSYQYLKDAFVG